MRRTWKPRLELEALLNSLTAQADEAVSHTPSLG
jgi:hypothetical protein